MTEQGTEAEEATTPELEIEFMGRTLWVRLPKPEQLLVWKRTLKQLQGAEVDGWNAEQVMAALERTRRIIDSVLVNPVDVTWLDDEMLDGRVDLKGTAEIINKTVEAYAEAAEREKAEHGTRAERRDAAKKKAARKAPGRKAETK
jgi:hypothetical protein